MNWKKNVFSYILWVVYTAAVSAGTLGLTVSICYRMNYPMEYGIAITIGYLLVAGLTVLAVRKLHGRLHKTYQGGSMAGRVLEGLAVVLLLALGIYLRLELAAEVTELQGGMTYYETARIAEGMGIPQVVHGATYLYLQLLHAVFLVFGNKVIAAVGLQLVLQMLAGGLFYMAVRKLAGRLAGIFTYGFWMLSPYIMESALELSPAYLLLTIYSAVLFLAGCAILARKAVPLWCAIAGILTGIVCYLDISGITLLFVFVSVFALERSSGKGFWGNRVSVVLCGVIGALAGFFGAIGIDAATCGKEFLSVLNAWAEIYTPGSFSVPLSTETGSFPLDTAVLFGVLGLGIFGFWCRKNQERQGIWVLITAALTMLQCFQMMEQNAGSLIYVYIFLVALAGTALEIIFVTGRHDAVRSVQAEEKSASIVVEDLDSDAALIEDVCRNLERAEQAALEAEIREREAKAEPVETVSQEEQPAEETEKITETSQPIRKVQFLENPLPLPKKHEPKVLGYRLEEVAEDSGYDYAVDDDDDFDI